MSGLLFHHQELGRSGCPRCGWSGVATHSGASHRVRWVGPGPDDYVREPTGRRPTVSDCCPACQRPPDPTWAVVDADPSPGTRDNHRRRSGSNAKRKAAKAARRRNR